MPTDRPIELAMCDQKTTHDIVPPPDDKVFSQPFSQFSAFTVGQCSLL